ncbi:MAG TPA: polysaccharide deacetylase family protein [Thermoanaerobaculia bacterium]|jgi:peptidoglycan/xylan/chitin deacetylase (PgdA/CDA1 family)|nr:polysaccharide deacetylase family protein [Thermoanaerobaculia bacterium]
MEPWRPTPFLAASGLLHTAGLLALAAAPRHWRWIAGTLMADHCAMAAAGLWPQSTWLGTNLARLPAAAARRGEVALTFDDGPDPEVTPRVLDRLAERGVQATFFLVGRRAAACPELAREIARRGHRVENHTWSHPNSFALYPWRAQVREVGRAQEVLAESTGGAPRLFRAPAGFRNPLLDPILAAAGLTLASWTRRGYDTVDGRPERVAARLLAGLAPGDVLLLHDGPTVARTPGGGPVVLEALPRVLDGIAGRGLTPTPFLAGAE